MILQPIEGQLAPNSCTIILMDYQPQFALTIRSPDGDILIHNAVNLAKIAKTFSIPNTISVTRRQRIGPFPSNR